MTTPTGRPPIPRDLDDRAIAAAKRWAKRDASSPRPLLWKAAFLAGWAAACRCYEDREYRARTAPPILRTPQPRDHFHVRRKA